MKDPGYSKSDYEKLLAERKERLKELACINQTTEILKAGKTIEESLQQINMILPPAWQFPEHTVSRIIYDGQEFKSQKFKETEWVQSQKFTTIEEKEGVIEIYYTKSFAEEDEGPFLKEERDLIINVANLITGYIDSQKAREFIQKSRFKKELDSHREKDDAPPLELGDLPRFSYTPDTIGTLRRVIPDLALLVLGNVLFFAMAFLAFLRYDVR